MVHQLEDRTSSDDFLTNSDDDFVLKVFSLIPDVQLSPIQTQKLFFLIAKRLHAVCGREIRAFNFVPYYYGPFDHSLSHLLKVYVYHNMLQTYSISGNVCPQICRVEYFRINRPLDTSAFLTGQIRSYIKDQLVEFVRKLGFRELCLSVCEEFPEMAKNCILIKSQV